MNLVWNLLGKLLEHGVLGLVGAIGLMFGWKMYKAYVKSQEALASVQEARVSDQKETTDLLIDLNKAMMQVATRLEIGMKDLKEAKQRILRSVERQNDS